MATLLTAPSSHAPPEGWLSTGNWLDAQITRLAEVLEARPSASLSFDCFDTLLWRAVPKPSDVFMLLGRRLSELGMLDPTVSPQLFMKLRIVADQEARQHNFRTRQSHEVDLDTIYSWKGWPRLTSLTIPQLARQELLVERDVTTADPALADLVRRVMTETPRRKLCIVSDTYFHADAIRFLLEGAGLAELRDIPIYTSCEVGLNKASGLLAVALRDMGIDPADCVHVGDSVEADVNPSVKLGATALHLPSSPGPTRRTFLVEGWLQEATEACDLVDPVVGDAGLTALRGRIVRQRPSSIDTDDATYWDVGATTLGPVLTGFAEWVHDRARDLGIETALCLMREGRFLAQVLDAVPDPHRRCSAVPFWASREACVRATFFEASRAELHRALWGVHIPTPDKILATLGLRVEDVPGATDIFTAPRTSKDSTYIADAFLELLAARQDVRERIVERSAERRKVYVRYLLEAIGDPDRPVAVVDLGYGGTMQALLSRMATAEGIDLDLRGLYLFTSSRALIRQLGGHLIEGFLADAGSPRTELATLDRSPEILEAIVTTFEGSLLEITAGGGVELTPRGPANDQDRQRAIAQAGIAAFQRAWNAFCRTNTFAAQRRLGESPDVLHRIIARFLAKPGLEVARAFAGWTQEASLGSDHTYRFVPEALTRCADHLAPEHLTFADSRDLHWVGAAASFADIEDQVRWLQEGRTHAGTFLNDDHHGYLVLEVGSADGGGQPEQTPLAWSKSGTGVISWHGNVDADRLVLATAGTSAVLRLDQVRVERADGSAQSFAWRGNPRTAPQALELVADRPVAEGTAVISGTDRVELFLPSATRAAVTGVEILYRAMPA